LGFALLSPTYVSTFLSVNGHNSVNLFFQASQIASRLIILCTMTRAALIIEDDPTLAELVQLHLRDANCAADIADDGVTGLEMFKEGNYELVVLDIMLPRKDGLSVCRDIRRLPGYVPILMLTAKSTELDRVRGLETGADDYLTKPFSVRELVARAKALLRRVDALSPETTSAAENEVIDRGNMRIVMGKRQVTVDGEDITLTAKEFDLLAHFARNPGQVFNRVQLLDQVWGYNHEGYEHTVNSHINRLRAKIESDPAKPKYILTVWGVGYKFAE
jgi:DNA-binding response OmpR family regulator